ncbi:MAG: peptide-methionine (S)-S-oxide reductase MsrA [Flavobacteriales bacterium]
MNKQIAIFRTMMLLFVCINLTFTSIACTKNKGKTMNNDNKINEENLDTVTLGAGCFWCVEAIFEELKGVKKVVSGYSGGHVENPSYKEVCTENTGHAEVCQITYDPNVLSFRELLQVFWKTHDPTTLNRQENNVGTQYRSAIFYHNLEQKNEAEKLKEELDNSGAFDDPIVTEISEYKNFYKAEDYHQQYYEMNGEAPYCKQVIEPKLEKFRKVFEDKLKE